jgi:L-rhamnose mutarotase
MKRMCGIWQLKNGQLKNYLKSHKVVWPEMLKAMRQAGIRNYSMFYRKDGFLVGYFEAKDPMAALRRAAKTDVSKRWHDFMRPFFDSVQPGMKKGKPLFLKEYFYTK